MSNTRDFKSLGVWGSDAVTPVPVSPISGTSYRDDTVTEAQNKLGDAFDTKPDSAVFNEKMFIITSFIDLIDKHGIVGWTDLVDYVVPAIVWGSDNNFYIALLSSGPGSTIRDPISEPLYWEIVTSATRLRQDLANETPGDEGAGLEGYNKFDINGGIDEGLTVKAALDEILGATNDLQGLTIRMSGSFDGTTGIAIGNTFNIFQNKAFIEASVSNPSLINFTIFADDDDFQILQFLAFVSTRAVQDPLQPVGNFVPTVQAITRSAFEVPPNTGTVKQGIKVWEYEMQTGTQQTLQQDFDLLVVSLDPIGPDTFP